MKFLKHLCVETSTRNTRIKDFHLYRMKTWNGLYFEIFNSEFIPNTFSKIIFSNNDIISLQISKPFKEYIIHHFKKKRDRSSTSRYKSFKLRGKTHISWSTKDITHSAEAGLFNEDIFQTCYRTKRWFVN